jgi:nucleotide-binding universal stress UspA family protein
MAFTKILCPTDFSPGSQHALRLAARMAGPSAELVIAHVWHTPAFAFGGGDPFPAEAIARLIADREHQLAAAADQARKLGAERVTSRFLTGVPWDEIVRAAQQDPAIDLVVTGTHGRTGVLRLLLGSVTERVIRHAPCSVLAARPPLEAATFAHILCPVDFSDSARHAVDRAAELVAPGGAGLVLLHVIELPIAYNGEPSVMPFLDGVEREAGEALARWAGELTAKVKVPVRTELRIGNPRVHTLAMLDHDPTFDLVVMGSHGRTGIGRALLGSVAESVVRHAPRPVLVARARA